jgi:hypothetical protein
MNAQKAFKSLAVAAFGISVFAVSLSSRAQALEPKVEVLSFGLVAQGLPLAEVCGRITGITVPAIAHIVSDPHTRKAAPYNATAGQDGYFCTTLVTFYGRIEVGIETFNNVTPAPAPTGFPGGPGTFPSPLPLPQPITAVVTGNIGR